ncbi:MAG: GreA/GreB family elongation factor [Chthoniobacteraceae bacterium]
MIACGTLSPRERGELHELKCDLAHAEIVAPNDVPADVITLNTRVELRDLDNGSHIRFTFVIPAEADIAQGKISVLSPLGISMLGYRVGDVFEWPALNGKWRLKIMHVQVQPEAAVAITA